jgi:predicted DNA-binding transcriptional regulator AlpA
VRLPAPAHPPVEATDTDTDDLVRVLTLIDSLAVEHLPTVQAHVVARMTARLRQEPAPPGPASGSRSPGLNVKVVAEASGMSEDWVYREARAGRLPFARKIGTRVTFDAAGLDRWLKRRRSGIKPV